MKVFLDMDGVLTDFEGALLKAHGIEDPYTFRAQTGFLGEYKLEPAFAHLTRKAFWGPTEPYEFWRDLKPYSWAFDLVSRLEDTVGQKNILILTSPTISPWCPSGKMVWLQKNLPQYSRQFAISPAKHFMAQPDSVLIDDSKKHVVQFMTAPDEGQTYYDRATAYLWPALGNERWLETLDSDIVSPCIERVEEWSRW